MRCALLALGLLAIAALGCATAVPPAELAPGALDAFLATPPRLGQHATYTGSDGAELGFVAYRAAGVQRRAALVYLHGIESHAGWFDQAAHHLSERGYDVFCLDRRGSGINRENRGLPSGHVDSYETLLADIRLFLRPLHTHYDAVYLVGLSWGGKLALGYGLTHPEDLEGLVLITPGIRRLVDVNVGVKLRVGLASVFAPRAAIKLPIESEMFTTTPEHLAYIENDPLRLHAATARFLMQDRSFTGYIDDRIPDNHLSVLVFLAGRDRIVDNEGILEVLARGAQRELEVIHYEDQTHSIQFDAPERMATDMDAWIRAEAMR